MVIGSVYLLHSWYKIKTMNKTEIRKLITKLFLEGIENQFPNWTIDDSESDGTLSLEPIDIEPGDKQADCGIFFHRSQHYLITLNWAPHWVKQVEQQMDQMLQEVIRKVNALNEEVT